MEQNNENNKVEEKTVEGYVIEDEPEKEPGPEAASATGSDNGETLDTQTSDADITSETNFENKTIEAEKSGFNPAHALILAGIALVSVIAVSAAGYHYWQTMLSDLSKMQSRINSAISQQQQLTSDIEQTQQTLQSQQVALEQQSNESKSRLEQLDADKKSLMQKAESMQLSMQQVSSKIGRSNNDWQLAEAEYLLRIANHRLTLSMDIATAIEALQQADQKLLQSGVLGVIDVRNRIAQEISQLKAVSLPDTTGMAARLQGLAQQVPALKLASTMAKNKSQQHAEDSKPRERSLDTILEDSWQGFQKLVVIRKHDQPLNAMLPPEQQYFLFQNLQLQLESARLALIRQETIIFNNSLDNAAEWIKSFFDTDHQATQAMLNELSALKRDNLSPSLPDISGALSLLTRYRGSQL